MTPSVYDGDRGSGMTPRPSDGDRGTGVTPTVSDGDRGTGPVPRPGEPVTLAPGLRRLTAPNPGVMTGPGTNTYLVGGAEVAVVDPGPDDPGHLGAIEAAVEAEGGRIRWVLVTHTHEDHAPGATPLARRAGATLVGHAARPGFTPDVAAGDGWALEATGFQLTALHTPGHAADHLCWVFDDGDRRVLLSGDHVMHGATVVIRPPDGDMAAYLSSLARVAALDPPVESIAPGHGRMLAEPAAVVAGVVAHRLAREEAVATALRGAGAATVDELVPLAYADVDAALWPVARYSLWAHLEKLAADGRAQLLGEPGVGWPEEDPGPRRWRWRAAQG